MRQKELLVAMVLKNLSHIGTALKIQQQTLNEHCQVLTEQRHAEWNSRSQGCQPHHAEDVKQLNYVTLLVPRAQQPLAIV